MHEKFLLLALKQAQLGRGHCAPNPSVGAIAVQNGNIISQSYHYGAGTPHAEQLLLAQLPPKLPDISLYITLEPCNHWGKTPPCVDFIIDYGVKEVIFSYLDPNPIVAQNNSLAKLKEHGIIVRHIPLKPIEDFYQSYSYWIKTKRPRVKAKMAVSLDGKIGKPVGDRVLLSNSLCSQFTHEQRSRADIILTSAKTVQLDNPKMNVRLNNTEQAKPVAIIDQHLNINPQSNIFSSSELNHIFHHQDKEVNYRNSSFHRMPLKNGTMDLDAIISHLGILGYHDVWVEVGGKLFSALHQEGLVHSTYLYLTPTLLGEKAISAFQYQKLFEKAYHVSWKIMEDNVIACFDWQGE